MEEFKNRKIENRKKFKIERMKKSNMDKIYSRRIQREKVAFYKNIKPL